jgi:hypothetical protein
MDLRQNTAATIVITGVRTTVRSALDGTTPIPSGDSVDISNLEVFIAKNGVFTELTDTGEGGDNELSVPERGCFALKLTVGNVNTLGRLEVVVQNKEGQLIILSVSKEFMVMDADVYDARYGSGIYENPAIALKTTVKANDPQGLGADEYFSLDAGSPSADEYNNMVVSVTDVTGGVTASRRVVDYYDYGGDMVVRVDYPFEFNLAAGDIVRIWANAYSGELGAAASDEIAQAVWDEPLASHTDPSATGGKLGSIDSGIYL